MAKRHVGKKYEWRCPKCGAIAENCGKGECINRDMSDCGCGGFICDCDIRDDRVQDADHGLYLDNPCWNARCEHCGWEGVFPEVKKSTKSLIVALLNKEIGNKKKVKDLVNEIFEILNIQ